MSVRMGEIAETVAGTVFVLGLCTVVPLMLFVPVVWAAYPTLTA